LTIQITPPFFTDVQTPMQPTHIPTLFAVTLACALTIGCNAPEGWDKEYACSGQEQSSAYFLDADPATAILKQYPLNIDFHLRSKNAMVKSQLTTIDSNADEVVSFSGKNLTFWMNGQFDKKAGHLSIIEEHQLKITGRTQQIRTSGQYRCV
jgi:hypothetical protein